MGRTVGANHSGRCDAQLHQIFSSLNDNVSLLYAAEKSNRRQKVGKRSFLPISLDKAPILCMALLLRVEIVKEL